MKPSTEYRFFSGGCSVVLILFFGLIYLAFQSHWIYAVTALGIMWGWLSLCAIRNKQIKSRDLAAFRLIFTVNGIETPEFKAEGLYGFPAFTLTFRNEDEKRRAEEAGCIAGFKKYLREYYGHLGGIRNPFDPNRALWVTYKGWRAQALTQPPPSTPH